MDSAFATMIPKCLQGNVSPSASSQSYPRREQLGRALRHRTESGWTPTEGCRTVSIRKVCVRCCSWVAKPVSPLKPLQVEQKSFGLHVSPPG